MFSSQRADSFKQHWLYFRLAIVFLTRIPLRISQKINDDDINHISSYFGFVGFFIAAVISLLIWPLNVVLPAPVIVLFSLAFSLLLTGAFHEDGLADTADGIGGGWHIEQKLAIMKDSRIGTYGASALVVSLLLKFQLLVSLMSLGFLPFIWSLFVAHSVSRIVAISFIASLPYVELDQQSKTKPVAKSLPASALSLSLMCLIINALIMYWALGLSLFYMVIFGGGILLIQRLLKRFFLAQISGYTGDVLGAAQQISELMIYTMLVAMLVVHHG